MSSNVVVDPGDLGGAGLPPTNHRRAVARRAWTDVVASRSATQLVLARLRHDKVAIASPATIVIISLAAICAPLISRAVGHGPNTQYLQTGLSPSGSPCLRAGRSCSGPTTSAATSLSASSTAPGSRCSSGSPRPAFRSRSGS